MAERGVDFLIVGGGIAGASCAETLRAEGAEGSILVIGREPDAPYHRPPLSKGYLRGEEGREELLIHPDGWWEDQGIELLTRTSVMKLDPGERTARLSSKEDVRFDRALLATGANVRRLRIEGAGLEGIHYLRAVGNSDAIRADADAAERVVVVGGSYIACEVAATLAARGANCAMVMQEATTLERSFGAEVGSFFQRVLEEHGVSVLTGDELERLEGDGERVGRAVTAGGQELECDAVVIGAGVMPDVMLARQAGLELGGSGGIVCSSGLETSAKGIFAAGDAAEYDSSLHGERVRIEHWEVAREQGATAACNMLGRGVAHESVPYFWSDLAGWASLEYVSGGGRVDGDPVVRGSLADGGFSAFWLAEDGRLSAALSVGRPGEVEEARHLIADRASPDPDALVDPQSRLFAA
ncbi:MAG: Ferredoxin reductase [uncultured Solirubrobacterales bacterium]|uniref:Ferredoxin reductase n=1 Tax=uncultured Solirubrobacterales bacterium TaxID=768556 RepID=A0A6J4S4L0_9ACTN|nr:MAG: Ferredoxin reductase [uncultured Solirubrobacterales bacterium]